MDDGRDRLPRVTFDDLRRRLSAVMFDAWVTEAGFTEDELRGYVEHGVPAAVATVIDEVFAGAVKVSDWSKILPSSRHRTGVLHKRLRPSRMNVDMHADQRLAISKGQGGDLSFRNAIRAKGFTQNSLAKAVGVSPAVLSLHRNKLRKIPRARAEAIAKLTGWAADARHWPCGIVASGQ